MTVDPDRLASRLGDAFGGTEGEARVVARGAVDLDDAGRYERDVGVPLTTDVVIEELTDAPGGTPADRWNWWIGSLEIAFGDYRAFEVRRFSTE